MKLLVKTRNEAMFAIMCRKAHIIRRSRHHWRSQHHLPVRANIISKRHPKGAFLTSSAYKPGSVVNGHQSSLYVTAELQSERFVPPPRCAGQALGWGVASNRVYSGPMLP